MSCAECEAPARSLWVLFGNGRQPQLEDVETGNWISLCRCPVCGVLWCSAPFEPYASFPYAARWPRDRAEWCRLHALDNGRTVHGWLGFAIAEHYRRLPGAELALVEFHRRRSYGHNPIDSPATFHVADLPFHGVSPSDVPPPPPVRRPDVLTRMQVRYTLTLEDHLAWYDYYLTLPEGAELRSSLPLVAGVLDRWRRWRYARRVVNPPSRYALGERTLELTEQGLREFSPEFAFGLPWSEMCLAAVTARHLFIAHTSLNANIVPLRFFENDADRAAFVAFARGHVHPRRTAADGAEAS